MSRFNMKTSYIAFGTVATLAAALAACSGGGGTSPTPSAGNNTVAAPPTSFGTSNVTGPTGTVKVAVVIPQHSSTTSGEGSPLAKRIHAQHGAKHADAHIRSMANTSPTALVRTTGVQINKYAAQNESARRSAQYVSSATGYMEFIVTDAANQNVVLDQVIYCSGGTCNGNYGVPVGTGYNVSLFLYDYCGYLLSAGTASGVAVTQGATTQVAITLNGVVAFLDVYANANQRPFIADAMYAQSFGVGVQLLDADYNVITTPGQPIDESLTPVTSITLSVSGSSNDLTPTQDQTLTVSPLAPGASPIPYAYTSTNYSYAGTGSESQINWSATAVTSGSPIVANVASWGTYTGGYSTGYDNVGVTQVQLIVTNPEGFPNPLGSPGYYAPGNGPGLNPLPGSSPSPSPSSSSGNQNQNNLAIPQFAQTNWNTWALEFPQLYNPGTGFAGLQEYNAYYNIAIPFTGTVTLTDNGGCSNVATYSNGPLSFNAGNTIVNLTAFDRTNLGPSNSCQIIATDNSVFSRTAYLNVFYDNPTLTIQSHARSAK